MKQGKPLLALSALGVRLDYGLRWPRCAELFAEWPQTDHIVVKQGNGLNRTSRFNPIINGGPRWDRTSDHLIKSQVLYH